MRSKDTVLRLQRFKVEDKRRQIAEMEFMIADMARKQNELDQQIEIEEKRSGISDSKHFNYSMTAKSIRDRRVNLDKSVNDLKEQLDFAVSQLQEEEIELEKAEKLADKESAHQSGKSHDDDQLGAHF